MPANKNAMTRYKILDELLSSRYHNYSLDDLTEMVSQKLAELYPETNGVVRRTIEKDINYLEYEGPFLVEIERYSVPSYNDEKQKSYLKRCLRYSHPGFSIFKKELSKDEEYLLREVLSLLGHFDGLPNLEGLEDLRKGLDIVQDQRKIISLTKNPLENSSLLGELFTSISQKQVITIQYHLFDSPDNQLSINLYPYLLKEYNRRWYLIAASEKDRKILNFGLERIDKVIPLPSHDYVEYEGNIEEIYEDIVGVTNFEEKEVECILFWVSDISKDYVITKPIHESQVHLKNISEKNLRVSYPSLINGAFFTISCKENYELYRELKSFGKELLVLSPTHIKNNIIEDINCMSSAYQKIN